MYSKFDGSYWSIPIDISQFDVNGEISYWADMALDTNNNPHVVWTEGPNDNIHQEIYCSYSNDGGSNWVFPFNISNTLDKGSKAPSICLDTNNFIYVVWEEYDQIYYSYKNNIAWSSPCSIFSLYSSSAPLCVMNGNLLNVIWQQKLDLKYDIFYSNYDINCLDVLPQLSNDIYIHRILL